MTSDFSVKCISNTSPPEGAYFPFLPRCSQGDPQEPRMERIRFRHFCQSVFGGSLHARSPRLELLDNHQACMSLLSPGKCMPVVKTQGSGGREKFVEVAKALVDSTFSCLSGPTPPLLSPLPPAVSLRGCVMAWTWLSPYPRSCEPPAVSYAGVARALVGSESEGRPPRTGGGALPAS